MHTSLDRLSRLLRPLQSGAALALAAAALMTVAAEPASAQRRTAGDAWTATGRSVRQAPQVERRRSHVDSRRVAQRTETRRVVQRARHPRDFRGPSHGRYVTRYERVWVPGRCERVWVPARYEWRFDPCGAQVRVLVEAGHYRTVQHPGRYEQRAVRVWVPARRTHRVSHVGRRYR